MEPVSKVARREIPVVEQIQLTEDETALFSALKGTLEYHKLKTTLRCAGGWVRDKLLGKESADIDIALDDIMGKDFADLVNEYLKSLGEETHTPGIIMQNPDQSKHLETAKLKVKGFEIDLVNLRAEDYTESSRIPTVSFGTPLQDALRRDFTINSMFYNLNLEQIEDLTQKGMNDLRQGLLRTPLSPFVTFQDDPLRVLRGIRFASRFEFDLDSDLKQAAVSRDVKEALSKKVSRERFGQELEGMLKAINPPLSIRIMNDLGLFSIVFGVGDENKKLIGEDYGDNCEQVMNHAFEILKSVGVDTMIVQKSNQPSSSSSNNSDEELIQRQVRKLYLFAALFLPLRGLKYGSGKKQVPVSMYICREEVKQPVKLGEDVANLHEHVPTLFELYSQFKTAANGQLDQLDDQFKSKLGCTLKSLKENWRVGVNLFPLLQLKESRALGVEPETLNGQHTYDTETAIQQINEMMSLITRLQLQNACQAKPLLDGREIMKELQIKGGPLMGQLTNLVFSWQFANPNGTREDCLVWLKQQHQNMVEAK